MKAFIAVALFIVGAFAAEPLVPEIQVIEVFPEAPQMEGLPAIPEDVISIRPLPIEVDPEQEASPCAEAEDDLIQPLPLPDVEIGGPVNPDVEVIVPEQPDESAPVDPDVEVIVPEVPQVPDVDESAPVVPDWEVITPELPAETAPVDPDVEVIVPEVPQVPQPDESAPVIPDWEVIIPEVPQTQPDESAPVQPDVEVVVPEVPQVPDVDGSAPVVPDWEVVIPEQPIVALPTPELEACVEELEPETRPLYPEAPVGQVLPEESDVTIVERPLFF